MSLIVVKDEDLCKGCERCETIDYEYFCRVKTKGCMNVLKTTEQHTVEWVSSGKEHKKTFEDGKIFNDLTSFLFNLQDLEEV